MLYCRVFIFLSYNGILLLLASSFDVVECSFLEKWNLSTMSSFERRLNTAPDMVDYYSMQFVSPDTSLIAQNRMRYEFTSYLDSISALKDKKNLLPIYHEKTIILERIQENGGCMQYIIESFTFSEKTTHYFSYSSCLKQAWSNDKLKSKELSFSERKNEIISIAESTKKDFFEKHLIVLTFIDGNIPEVIILFLDESKERLIRKSLE